MDLALLDQPAALDRIAIVGCCGAGKSTLASRLSNVFDAPVVHLDRLYWKPGWVEATREEFDARHASAIEQPRWIIDGNYRRTMAARSARANLVVLVVVPTRVALWRVIRRTFVSWRRSRPDMADGCVEQPFRAGTWEFWRYVARFNRHQLPSTRALLDEHAANRTIVVESSSDADALVAHLAAVR